MAGLPSCLCTAYHSVGRKQSRRCQGQDRTGQTRGIVTARLSYNTSSTYSIIEGPIESELEIWDDSAGDPPTNWRRVYENLLGLQQALRVIGRLERIRTHELE